MVVAARAITSSKSHPAIRNTIEVRREEGAEMVGDKLMRSLIVWSLGLVAQTVRMQSLVRNEKESARRRSQDPSSIAALPIDPWDGAQPPGLLKMNFIFKMPGWYSELAVGTRLESAADDFMSLPLLCN